MSHFTTIKTKLRDTDALRAACAELGLNLVQGGVARGYGNTCMRADWVIQLKGPYDIAMKRSEDGSFSLVTDWFGGHVEKEVGKDFSRLLQIYGVHKAMHEAAKKGLPAVRQAQPDGAVKVFIITEA